MRGWSVWSKDSASNFDIPVKSLGRERNSLTPSGPSDRGARAQSVSASVQLIVHAVVEEEARTRAWPSRDQLAKLLQAVWRCMT
jgi:hypothetical protein